MYFLVSALSLSEMEEMREEEEEEKGGKEGGRRINQLVMLSLDC